MEKNESRVVHPKYYNSHQSGVECIDVIRHYVCDIANAMKYMWRSGLKNEGGMSIRDKEIEDCRKAIWYLEDFLHNSVEANDTPLPPFHPSGVDCETIASCYCSDVGGAFRELWWTGLVIGGSVLRIADERNRVENAIGYIKEHINVLLQT